MSTPSSKPLFVVRFTADGEIHDAGYDCIEDCLEDLRIVYEALPDPRASIWQGSMRITRDLDTYQRFAQQLVGNSTTILRALLPAASR